MFHKRKAKPFFQFEATNGKQLFKRAATLSAGIFFLWIALHIMPKPGINIPATEASTEEASTHPAYAKESQSTPMGFLKGTQVIAGILLLALIGFMYYRHKKTTQESPHGKSLKTLNRLQLGPNQHIFLIECGQDALLISATNSQINLLKKMPLASLAEGQHEEHLHPTSYTFSAPVSTQKDPGDFASLLHSYSSANTN